MIELIDLHPAVLLTLPLGLALGVDLYLALILIGLITHLEWTPLPPGRLGEISSLGVLFVPALLYLVELIAERLPPQIHFVWHAFQALVRPMGAVLVGLLLLQGEGLVVLVSGSVVLGLMASLSHAAKVGGGFLRRVGSPGALSPWVAGFGEDTLVLVLVAVSLESARLGLATGILGVALLVIVFPAHIRAFAFAMRAIGVTVTAGVATAGWTDAERLPRWIRDLVATTPALQGPILRGLRVGCQRLPGVGTFRSGWILSGVEAPCIAFKAPRSARTVPLEGLGEVSVDPGRIVTRIGPRATGDGPWSILVPKSGPHPAKLVQSLFHQ
ncbi:DUF4126 domain-containing protein [Gemmatimonadota bacterium]